jgi:hypothetical protein
MPAADFVHEFITDKGNRRFAVAYFDWNNAQYIWPLDRETQRLTGCHSGFCKKRQDCDRIYATRKEAMDAAGYWHVNYGRKIGNPN